MIVYVRVDFFLHMEKKTFFLKKLPPDKLDKYRCTCPFVAQQLKVSLKK